ncbi:hypothetical protein DFR49_1969 [Hephaestia caeni]|uniref:Uncharacterized protein n=1 Tax=Hephaestia caeni TaxID=645617 RepID=A0A397PDN5_9SPHN|nr:hypothetical protein [Hephaestia caeni]RIA43741.1 hypothetical protein DFR49_1969 [Hephaestia caeni]
MSSLVFPAALLLLLAAPAAAPAGPPGGIAWQQVTIHERIVVRVPRMPIPPGRQPIADVQPLRWVEKDAPKCVAVDTLAAATITEPDSVDLVVRGGSRLRAKLGDDCPALDFYSGFYLKRTSDGRLCARRDSIRSRSGDNCPIVALKHLVPAR